jgi:hypothetical protein
MYDDLERGKEEGEMTDLTTFDLDEVRSFTANLDARMAHCETHEGMECATLDDKLRHFAYLCWDYRETVRAWARAVFAGRVAYDAAADREFFEKGMTLHGQSYALWRHGEKKADGPCYILDGHDALGNALLALGEVLSNWVTPKRAVGPSARHEPVQDQARLAAGQRAVEALSPLPADWQPIDPEQRKQYKLLRERRRT